MAKKMTTSKKRKKKKKRKNKKKTIRKARMVSRKRYSNLLKKKKSKKKLSNKENNELEKALFVNYCKCIKKIKYSNEYERGSEYPICMNSIYKKRNITPPKNVSKKCKGYV